MTRADLQRPVEFPPGVDARALLAPTRHGAWQLVTAAGAAYRRHITRQSPLLFAVTYLSHWLRQQDTGLISFAPMHLDMAAAAQRWPAGDVRDVWIAPRGAAKTMWTFGIGPLWALAHGHRRFCVGFSYTEPQAVGHLSTMRAELDTNELLLHDFHELRPKRARGARNTLTTVTASGATVAARGLGGTNLGLRVGADRPDLLVGDDLEPSEADYSPAAKAKLQGKLLDGVLPMGARGAVVQLAGTVTMRGSLIHDAVREAKGEGDAASAWVRGKGFTPRYYPPITAAGESMWPQRWTVEQLRAEQAEDPRGYGLNMLNDPRAEDGAGVKLWTPAVFQFDERFPTVERCIHADVAVTTGRRSDLTVLVQVGKDASGLRACIERVEWGRWSPPEIRDKIHEFCRGLRVRPFVRVESNQGGETWLDSLAPWPRDVLFGTHHATVPKRIRIGRAFNDFERRAAWLAWPMPDLQAALCEYPDGAHDDIPDAVAGALEWVWPY